MRTHCTFGDRHCRRIGHECVWPFGIIASRQIHLQATDHHVHVPDDRSGQRRNQGHH
jgi:hypothetical protein